MVQAITFPSETPIMTVPLSGPALFGESATTASLLVDPLLLATGFRVSDLIGRTIINDAGEAVGKLDDLIIGSSEKVPFAELAVGGFLGMGAKYIVVPYCDLEVRDQQMIFHGTTKESLMGLPDLSLATGDRTSVVVGAAVVNKKDEMVGKIDDLFITANENMHFAVISVGVFLGIGEKYVIIPYMALEMHDKYLLFPAATKECLENLPEFKDSH